MALSGTTLESIGFCDTSESDDSDYSDYEEDVCKEYIMRRTGHILRIYKCPKMLKRDAIIQNPEVYEYDSDNEYVTDDDERNVCMRDRSDDSDSDEIGVTPDPIKQTDPSDVVPDTFITSPSDDEDELYANATDLMDPDTLTYEPMRADQLESGLSYLNMFTELFNRRSLYKLRQKAPTQLTTNEDDSNDPLYSEQYYTRTTPM